MIKNPEKVVVELLQQATEGDSQIASLVGYRLVKELGIGGMGAVYLIENENSNTKAALKIILPLYTEDEQSVKLFKREIANCYALKHPNIVEYRGGGEIQGIPFLLMEYCDGGNLNNLLQDNKTPLALDQAMSIMENLFDGLEFAHNAEIPDVELADGCFATGRGLVHRDLKPLNILLAYEGEKRIAKISDLGLAKAFELAGLSGITSTSDECGSLEFMPRQLLIDYKYAQPEVDVWASAACLYTMLTLKTPRDFQGNDPWLVVKETEPVPILQRNSNIPLKLAHVIDHALDDSTELYFANVPSFRAALKSCF